MQVDLSKYNNDWFQIGASKIKLGFWFLIKGAVFMNPLFPFMGVKLTLLRWFGAKVGKDVVIKTSVNIKFPWNLTIGNNVWLGERVWIENQGHVKLDDSVCLSQGATLMTGNHNYKKATFDLMVAPIHLQHGVWIGCNALVCPGLTIGEHAVLTVGSVAVKDLEPFGIYTGNPCVKTKQRQIEAL
jgi:putative colanic acid biosynthesis acetyltransferase WcaF